MDKKNNLTIVLVIVIILAIVVLIFVMNKKPTVVPEPISQTDTELNLAVSSDTTKNINDSLNNINLDDTTDQDLLVIDQDLEKL